MCNTETGEWQPDFVAMRQDVMKDVVATDKPEDDKKDELVAVSDVKSLEPASIEEAVKEATVKEDKGEKEAIVVIDEASGEIKVVEETKPAESEPVEAEPLKVVDEAEAASGQKSIADIAVETLDSIDEAQAISGLK